MSAHGNRPSHAFGRGRWLATLLAVFALVLGTAAPVSAASAAVPTAAGALSSTSTNVAGRTLGGPVKTSLAGFKPGNIISDAVFTDNSTMTEAQIQTFFNSKVKACRGGSDKWGPIVCLKDFKTNSVDRPADAYCTGYKGAKGESAARVIYRVAQACNINPRVLIVMLEKEQSLVTHTWPSAWRYDKALGQGCPDDAACNPAYVGFFYQIYGAARQMQVYMEGRYFTWYAPGKTWNILYNPNRACGSAPVYVANKATAALYYYTPYQPNAAALRAGYGTGDSCSSYGNRNFYNLFTDWFGPTQASSNSPSKEIASLYAALGGASGVLGKAGPTPSCSITAARCTQSFAQGIITWTKALGALTVYGDVYKQYAAQGGLGGKLGYPAATPKAVSDPNGDGITQQFDKGWIHSSAKGTFTSNSTIMDAYSSAGWLRGDLGWPTSPVTCTDASCVQDFTGGMIGYFTGKAAFAVTVASSGGVNDVHAAQGGAAGPLGAASADRQLVQDPNGNGLAQKYAGGWIHASDRGIFASSSAIMTGYSAAGWLRGDLGWPIAAEQKVKDPNGNGSAQSFEGGWIHSSDKGSFASSTKIMTAYSAAGWLRGRLGWPTSTEVCTGQTCTQAFNGGIISFSGDAAAKAFVGVSVQAISKVHSAEGGNAGKLGAVAKPVQVVSDANGGGFARQFAHGWIHSSAAGTYSSSTTVMRAYSAAGWLRGDLGWPTSKEACSGTYCAQSFQGGIIAYNTGKPAVAILGVKAASIADAHKALGGNAGSMGAPAAAVQVVSDVNGNGLAQKFAKGWIHVSKAGAFASSTPIMTAYSSAKWLRGPLAWPTSAEKCVETYCSQSFTGGTIAYTKGKAAVPLVGVKADAIGSLHAAEGGARGKLGAAALPIQVVSDANGNGLAQKFDNGWIHASAKGTFSSSTPIMTAYSEAGWLRGPLGWPTGKETCTATSCSQRFSGGTISYPIGGGPAVTTYR